MQFAAASGLSRAERGVVRAVHLGFPANASTWSASHFFWLWQFHFWPAFLLRVSIGPGTCGLTRTVTYMLFCFIFPPPPPRSLDLFTQSVFIASGCKYNFDRETHGECLDFWPDKFIMSLRKELHL